MTQRIKRIIKILQKEGLKTFIYKSLRTIYFDFLVLPYLIIRIKVFQNYNIDKLVDFGLNICQGAIGPLQIKAEVLTLFKTLDKIRPKTIIEIGTANGGTLFLLSRIASDDAVMISIDLPGGGYGGGYPYPRVPLYKSFAMKRQKIYLLRSDSHNPLTLEKINALLGGIKVDVLFIDGDHTYGGVKKDFEMYSPLVGKNGMVVFHDICPHPAATSCEVGKFWDEIKKGYKYVEIVEDWSQGWAGIGLLINPSSKG